VFPALSSEYMSIVNIIASAIFSIVVALLIISSLFSPPTISIASLNRAYAMASASGDKARYCMSSNIQIPEVF